MPEPPRLENRGALRAHIWTFQLVDFEHPDDPPLPVRVAFHNGTLEIYAEGYGMWSMEPGTGPVMFIEKYDKRFRAVAWEDINEESQTNEFDFEGAREELRES